LVAAAYKKSL
jgi:hypothetical protein